MPRSTLIFLIVLTAPVRLHSQAPRDGASLLSLDRSLGHLTASAIAESNDGPTAMLQRGYRDLHDWLSTGNESRAELALRRFDQASARRPHWGWPHYAMARTFVLMHQRDVPKRNSAGSRTGESYLQAAFRQLDDALKVDPGLEPARKFLVQLTLPSGDRELMGTEREALGREVERTDALPGAVVVWARHLRAERKYRQALAAFDRAARLGFDPASIDLERARTLAELGRDSAATASYWSGVAAMTPISRELYRQDLGYFLDADSVAVFDAVPDSMVANWLHRFWSQRDAASTAPRNGRLADQLNRWAHVFARYRVPSPWRITDHHRVDFAFDSIGEKCIGSATPFYDRLPIHPPLLPGDPRSNEPLLDHRAFIYLRHGPPTVLLTPGLSSGLDAEQQGEGATGGLPPVPKGHEGIRLELSSSRTEIWIYWFEGSWRMLNFRGSDALGHHAATTLSSYLPTGNASAWLALATVLPYFQTATNRLVNYRGILPNSCLSEVRQAIAQQRADADTAIKTDSDTPPIRRPWGAELQFFGIGSGATTSGRALLTFAIPLNRLNGDTLSNGTIRWRIAFRYSAFRLTDGKRIDLDTTRTFVAHRAAAHGNLTGWFELPLGAGRWQVAALVRQSADSLAGAYALTRNLNIAGAGQLTISDIVTGRNDQAAWPAPDGPFPVNTLGAWTRDTDAKLWYEVRGLGRGDEYRTTIEVSPVSDKKTVALSVSTNDRATGSVTIVRRSLGLGELKPGRYRLSITIASGSSAATRARDIVVIK